MSLLEHKAIDMRRLDSSYRAQEQITRQMEVRNFLLAGGLVLGTISVASRALNMVNPLNY